MAAMLGGLEERRPAHARRAKALGPDKRGKKVKLVSIKNQIRSTKRMLRKKSIVNVFRMVPSRKWPMPVLHDVSGITKLLRAIGLVREKLLYC